MTTPETSPEAASVSRRTSIFATLYRHTAVRYLIAGGLSFIVDFGLLFVMKQVLGWPLVVATVVAFLVSFAFNYLIQRIFSFGSQTPHGVALIKYSILVAFNTVATVVIVALINDTAAGWGIGKVISTAATTIWNYFAYRYWVFSPRGKNGDAVRQPSA